MNNILITGAAGFIGSHFLKSIIDDQTYDQIVAFDKLTYAGRLERIESCLSDRVVFIQGDICDYDQLSLLFQKYQFRYMINFAAESHVDRSLQDLSSFIRTNVEGVKNLLDVSLDYQPRFLHISTDEVYGEAQLDSYPMTEQACLNPGNPYAASKASAEMMINAYRKSFDYPVMMTRSSNNYGPDQHEEKMISKVIHNILLQKNIPIYGDGVYYRNWLYVEDHVKYVNGILKEGQLGETYNISGNHFTSNIDLVSDLIKVMKDSFDHAYLGEIDFIKDRKGHDLCYLIDDEKIQRLLQFDKISFEEGIVKTIQSIMGK